MAQDTKISWTDHSFNTHWGCDEVPGDPACSHCYAREFSKRLGKDLWGEEKPRPGQSDNYWESPFRWDRAAAKAGKPAFVFANSMSDLFENRRDLDSPRAHLYDVIERTGNLIWLLLSKRHNDVGALLPAKWLLNPRPNVWLGITAATQDWADERVPEILRVPAAVHFVSAEPLLSAIDFTPWLAPPGKPGLNWTLIGGESGHGARRMDPEWPRDILRQCRAAGASFHFKQKGTVLAREFGCKDKAGKDSSEWPEDLRVQEFPALSPV